MHFPLQIQRSFIANVFLMKSENSLSFSTNRSFGKTSEETKIFSFLYRKTPLPNPVECTLHLVRHLTNLICTWQLIF